MIRSCAPFVLAILLASCGGPPPDVPTEPAPAAPPARVLPNADGGMPRRGPGDLYNACERIFCLTHEANYALEHFLAAHDGWILHAAGQGDVFVPRGFDRGPGFTNAGAAALSLCGAHVHPWFLGKRASPVKRSGYNVDLGYTRAHFAKFGTRLAPCCLNGLGWSYLHAAAPRSFRFADVDLYREMPGVGWQAPFQGGR